MMYPFMTFHVHIAKGKHSENATKVWRVISQVSDFFAFYWDMV